MCIPKEELDKAKEERITKLMNSLLLNQIVYPEHVVKVEEE